MPISRSLLHENKVTAFKDFLQSKGWTIERTKGFYEVIRATKKGQKTIVLFQRTGTKHITIGWDMEHAYKLIKEFVYQRRNSTMSHADDIAEGNFCYKCGEYLGDGFGCMQLCPACEEEEKEEENE